MKIDTISSDEVISSGYDETQAQTTVDRFKEFLETNKDQIVALQILYGRPYAQRRLTYEALEELRDALKRPPWLLEPVNIWRAYKRLNDARVRGNATRILTDIVMLVRFALGKTTCWSRCPLTSRASSICGSVARKMPAASIPQNSLRGSTQSAITWRSMVT